MAQSYRPSPSQVVWIWRAIAKKRGAQFLNQVKVSLPLLVVPALLHFIDTFALGPDSRATVFDACGENEVWRARRTLHSWSVKAENV